MVQPMGFEDTAPASGKLYDAARAVLAGGMAHDLRFMHPFPVAIERASGARKWDVDGNEYVDYLLGLGAILLGHAHPAIVEAVREQVTKGTNHGAAHPGEVEWAELVCALVPSAERVRFVSSGTEAVLLAARVARAFTRRPTIVKFHLHYHGWSEIGMVGLSEPFDAPAVGQDPRASVVAVAHTDEDGLRSLLERGDVAAVILEPSGSRFGHVPVDASFLASLRELTASTQTLLIFDEVVTGFRWAPGGVQERTGVLPDLTTLGKILGGGLPAGAVAGRADVMAVFEQSGVRERDRFHQVRHYGTFNANPLSAAAGVAALRQVATGEPGARAERTADELRAALNDVLRRAGADGRVYGESSAFHIQVNADEIALRTAMLARGVDLAGCSGLVSAAHGDDEIAHTVAAFEGAVRELG
jgi:glutamate-1-semialdehyde 2,1-aminomutase